MIPATIKLKILSLARQGYEAGEIAGHVGVDGRKVRGFIERVELRRAMQRECKRLHWPWQESENETREEGLAISYNPLLRSQQMF